MNIHTIAPDLHLIPLDQNMRGFTHFIGAWLYQGNKTFLIDVGPAATIPYLMEALTHLGANHLDAILLTHIHLDHAGGIGHMAKAFPDTPIFGHSAGLSHLEDPGRLWEGSLKTLGDTASAYGQIRPVPSTQLADASNMPWDEIRPILTPGHAPHHVSFQISPYLFAGETGGVFQSLGGGREYLRPATPPRFFMEIALKSVDALIALKPDTLCYGHFGIRDEATMMLKKHREQMIHWEEIIQGVIDQHGEDDVVNLCLDALFKNDPCMAGYHHMDRSEQERERFFLVNSIKGYLGYLKDKGK